MISTGSRIGFDAPEPSLCDTCVCAYGVADGGVITHEGKVFEQRYCPFPPPGETAGGRDICASGYQECEYYTEEVE